MHAPKNGSEFTKPNFRWSRKAGYYPDEFWISVQAFKWKRWRFSI